jgi:CelD/BcsL family acetyltransferase involved in cellulose biosynthesis
MAPTDQSSKGLLVTVLDEPEVRAIRPAWEELYATSGRGNPFASPTWMLSWADHFVPPSDWLVLAVHRGDDLVALAPYYRHSLQVAGYRLVTKLEPFGSGQHVTLTELPELLTRPGQHRGSLRAIVEALYGLGEWDWATLPLTAEQGWFEQEWLPAGSDSHVMERGSRACVVMPLSTTWDETRKSFKRNIKESIRRSVNRLDRDKLNWRVDVANDAEDLDAALKDLTRLHQARSEMPGVVNHPDVLRVTSDRVFLADAARELTKVGGFSCFRLFVDDVCIAALAVLRSNEVTYMSVSGLDPSWWWYAPVTTLCVAAIRQAIDAGDRLVNFSTGPSPAKLRWSEQLDISHSFAIVRGHRRSRMAFDLYWARSAAIEARRRRTRVKPPAAEPGRLSQPVGQGGVFPSRG